MNSRTPTRFSPLTHQVKDILTSGIRDGTYPPGSQLPTENKLATDFQVSRATIRRAIDELSIQGLVIRRQGVGTFVSQLSRLSHSLNEAMEFYDLITRNGFDFGVEFIQTDLILPDSKLINSLKIKKEVKVLQTFKIFTANSNPVIYCINHIPISLLAQDRVQEVLTSPKITEPLYGFLEQYCNQWVNYHIASLRADLAQNCPFPKIMLAPNTPILVIEEVGYNTDERPIWHSYEYYPPSKMTFELIRHRIPKK